MLSQSREGLEGTLGRWLAGPPSASLCAPELGGFVLVTFSVEPLRVSAGRKGRPGHTRAILDTLGLLGDSAKESSLSCLSLVLSPRSLTIASRSRLSHRRIRVSLSYRSFSTSPRYVVSLCLFGCLFSPPTAALSLCIYCGYYNTLVLTQILVLMYSVNK